MQIYLDGNHWVLIRFPCLGHQLCGELRNDLSKTVHVNMKEPESQCAIINNMSYYASLCKNVFFRSKEFTKP